MSYESRRYDKINTLRVAAVEEAYFYKPNPLYRPRPYWARDEGFKYSRSFLPKEKFKSVDEALKAIRQSPRFKYFN